MDLISAVVSLLLFILTGAILTLSYMFGMREKSYEEALAEKRHFSGLLAATQSKDKKPKVKKINKKAKEKPVTTNAISTSTSSTSISSQKVHVEFVEPVEIEPTLPASPVQKKRSNNNNTVSGTGTKKEKVKSILLNKDQSIGGAVKSGASDSISNHFEQIHPKDEFELRHTQKEDEKQNVEIKINTKSGKNKNVQNKIVNEEQNQKQTHKKLKETKVAQEKEPEPQQQPPKEQRKSKEIKVAQEKEPEPIVETVATKSPDVTVQQSHPQQQQLQNNVTNVISVKEKKKKKSEFNVLQQLAASDKHNVNVSLLVPLVRKADLSRSEIQILIDMLLNKQHEAPIIVDEWTEGRADPVQKLKKQLAEKERALTEEQEALQSAQARLREVRAELNSERSRLVQNCRQLEESLHANHLELKSAAARLHAQNQQIQQLQSQTNDEMMNGCKLRDELKAAQMQRQQFEMHLQQKQDAETSLQAQLTQLRVELQEQQNINGNVTVELHAVHEKSQTDKEMLHEQIRQMKNQLVHYENEADQRQELVRKLEESRLIYSELEHRYGVAHRNETEWKMRCERFESNSHELQSEIGHMNLLHKQQQDEHKRVLNELQAQLTSVQAEKSHLEAQNDDDDKNRNVLILNLQNELDSIRTDLKQRQTQFNQTEIQMKQFEHELEMQRNKNDDLRKKNWKVMEALNNTESMLRTAKQSKDTNKLRQEEEEEKKNFVQRLFPDLVLPTGDNWLKETEVKIVEFINNLQKRSTSKMDNNDGVELSKLQAELTHYRAIIDDTEGMLNKLQSHVEQEEINWRSQIESKEIEIEALKQQQQKQNPIQLQEQIVQLEEKLKTEEHVRHQLEMECETYRLTKQEDNNDDNGGSVDHFAEIEKINQEKMHLVEQLANEQKRCREMSEQINCLRVNVAQEELEEEEEDCSEVVVHPIQQKHATNGTASIEMAQIPASN